MVGERTLFCVVWDERSNLGLVRFYAQEASQHIEVVLKEIAERPESENQGLDDAAVDEILDTLALL